MTALGADDGAVRGEPPGSGLGHKPAAPFAERARWNAGRCRSRRTVSAAACPVGNESEPRRRREE
ncbi:MAG: hypothetical protein ACRDZV_12985, partial [Acidimicrobiia bacterium]